MARYAPKGTLIDPTKPGGNYACRVRIDGKRKWFDLGTPDRVIAMRKMHKIAKLAAEGKLALEEAPTVAASPESLIESLRAYVRARVGRVKMASSEAGYTEHQIAPHDDLVRLPVTEIRAKHLLDLLSRIIEMKGAKTDAPISLQTLKHCRALLSRFFRHLVVREVIAVNPMGDVTLATLRSFCDGRLPTKDKRPHVALNDAEYNRVLAHPVDLSPVKHGKRAGQIPIAAIEAIECKVILFAAAGLSGARTHELLQTWDWAMIDRETFGVCKFQRAKIDGKPADTHIIPAAVRPYLAAWWETQGRPSSGAVFPTQRGPRRGERRKRQSLAHRMRRYFVKCGVTREDVHADTRDSRRWDFHTERRAAKTRMDRAGMSQADAMAAMGHSDAKTHADYALPHAIELPAAALPQINASTGENWSETLTNLVLGPAKCLISERDTGFEPATSSLGNSPTKHNVESLTQLASIDWVAAARRVSPCFVGIRFASLVTDQNDNDQKNDV